MTDQLTAAQRVAIARHAQRPNVRDYIDGLFPHFFELRGIAWAGRTRPSWAELRCITGSR